MLKSEMIPGKVYVMNGHEYGKCSNCFQIVKLDKFILGSMHSCG